MEELYDYYYWAIEEQLDELSRLREDLRYCSSADDFKRIVRQQHAIAEYIERLTKLIGR